MSSYYNQGVQVIIGNGQNFPGTPRISLIPFIQNAYDKGLLNFTVLPPGSISLAEIQDISTAKILGRSTAGSGVIEQISIGTGLSLSGGILSSTATAAPGGSDTQIQYNNAGAFGGSSQLIFNAGATNTLDITGSDSTSAMNALRVRNSSSTNLMTVRNDGNVGIGTNTPASTLDIQGGNTIDGLSVRLTGQNPYIAKFYNNAYSSSTAVFQYFAFNSGTFAMGSPSNTGVRIHTTSANAGYTTPEIDLKGDGNLQLITGTGKVGFGVASALGHTHIAFNTTASTPSMLLSGTGFSGGTATTTKPTLLIEPTGTTSTGWSTSGTKLGVNAESGFTGNLLDFQVNGSSVIKTTSTGVTTIAGPSNSTLLNIESNTLAGTGTSVSGIRLKQADSYVSVFSVEGDGRTAITTHGAGSRGLTILALLTQFGGTTSSYPALKRNGTGLDVRLADDSGYGLFNAGKTTIYGSGATSATTSLLVQNSSSTDLLKVRDDGVVKIGSFTEGYTTGYGLILTNDIKCNAINFRSPAVADGTIYGLDGSAPNGVRIITGGIANYIFKGVGANFDPCMLMTTGFNPSSGSSDKNMNYFNPSLQITGTYSGTVRNLYVNASISTLASARYIDIEATKGDVLFNTISGSTAVGTSTIVTNAKLEVASTSKGFLPPRMTATERDAVAWVSGDAGMMIFNSTLVKLQVWNGTAWETITSI